MRLPKTLRAAAAAAVFTLGAAAAQASVQSHSFVVELDLHAPATYTGSLSFDDASTSTLGPMGESLYELLSFNFEFVDINGDLKTYTLADLASAAAAVDSSGFQGIDADESSGAFSLLSAVPTGSASFFVDLGNLLDTGNVSFRLPDPGTVPAPATVLLAGLGLMGARLCRRRSAGRG